MVRPDRVRFDRPEARRGMLAFVGDIIDPVKPDDRRAGASADLTARIQFLTATEGGRHTPVTTGYRGACDLGLPQTLNDAVFHFPGREWLTLGEEGSADVWLLYPELERGRLFPGLAFTVCEGSRVVARGIVVTVLHSSLARPE